MRISRGSNGNLEQILLVEVKCFSDNDSTTRDLYTAIGQYLVYRAMIQELRQHYGIYLSIPHLIFDEIFDVPVMRVVEEIGLNIVVINLESEAVVKWITSST
jgi:hypothetical protein